MLESYRTALRIVIVILFSLIFTSSIVIAESESEDVRVGYSMGSFRSVNPKDAQIAIELWLAQLCRQSGISFKIKAHLFNNISELVQAIDNHELDFIGLNSCDYVTIRDKAQIEPALITTFGTNYGNEYILIVNKDMNIHNLSQLKGKKIILHIGSNPIPLPWLNNLLKKQGLPEKDRFFNTGKEVDKASQAILPVFFRQADACIVTRRAFETISELNPQISQKLEPVITSPLFADSVVLFRKDYKSANKKIFIDTAINIKKYPQGKQIMTLF